MRFTTAEAAAICDGEVHGSDVAFDGASTDTRELQAGELFVPLLAERDGHEFLAAAAAAGAAACLTRRDRLDAARRQAPVMPLVAVDDTEAALPALGAAARERIAGRMVAITGSVGKTSTKDLLAAALAAAGPVHASRRSFNNAIGVPLTFLGATGTEWALVTEVGTNAPGEIAALTALVRPEVGVVTAVGSAHTAALGTVDGVAREKGDLIAALPPSGTAVLNVEDSRVLAMAGRSAAPVITFGLDSGDVRAEKVTLDRSLRASFVMATPWGTAPVRLRAAGLHTVRNALGAAAAALVLGTSLEATAAGLGAAELSPWRMAVATAASGALIINDAYNANPMSMAAALRALAAAPADRRVAVLGTMAELGAEHASAHAAVAALAADLGIEAIAVAEAAYGLPTVPDATAALAALGTLGPNDAILVKASRVAALETLAEALLD